MRKFALLALASIFVLFADHALADPDDLFCRAIAEQAMFDISIERELHCGLSGPRWRNDFGSQFQLCMAHRKDPPPPIASQEGNGVFVFDEQRARKAQIDACRAAKLRAKLSAHRPRFGAVKTPADAVGRHNP